MRRKRTLLLTLVTLIVVAGAFIVSQVLDEPLVVEMKGMAPQPDGSVNLSFGVSNQTARSCNFVAYPEILSGRGWFLDDGAGKPIGLTQQIRPHGFINVTVRASDRAGLRRLQIKYQLGQPAHRGTLEWLMRIVHFNPIPYYSRMQEFTTAPTNFPARQP